MNADNLSEKKIFCFNEFNNQFSLIGFEFTSGKRVDVTTASNTRPIDVRSLDYKTTADSILIQYDFSPTIQYYISRKDLNIKGYNAAKVLFTSEQCELTQSNIKVLFNNKLSKYKKGNVI